jgi:hypothetical protein
MKPVLFLVALAGLAACSDPDREWAKACTANGFEKELCECIAEKVPAEQRDALGSFTHSTFGGGWVLMPNEEPAATCARYVDQARAAAKS